MVEKVTIQTERPAAAKWNGKSGEMVRKVEAPDPAYNDKLSQGQVVVAIDGPAPGQPREEVYFFADEVVGYEPKAGEPRPQQFVPGYPSNTPGQIGQQPFNPQPGPPNTPYPQVTSGETYPPGSLPGEPSYESPEARAARGASPTQAPLNPAPGQPLQPGVYNPPTPPKPQG